jgi:ornithine cyclodeaminase
LGDILLGSAPDKESRGKVTVFSPFGLGILDLAVSQLVCDLARHRKIGDVIESFLSA